MVLDGVEDTSQSHDSLSQAPDGEYLNSRSRFERLTV